MRSNTSIGGYMEKLPGMFVDSEDRLRGKEESAKEKRRKKRKTRGEKKVTKADRLK